jgi:hypothetical protein
MIAGVHPPEATAKEGEGGKVVGRAAFTPLSPAFPVVSFVLYPGTCFLHVIDEGT